MPNDAGTGYSSYRIWRVDALGPRGLWRILATFGLVIALLGAGLSSAGAYVRPGITTRVNLTPTGGESQTQGSALVCAGTASFACTSSPIISGNGRYVAFSSYAPDLVSNDLNAASDVFRTDVSTGRAELASLASDGAPTIYPPGTEATSRATDVAISESGRYVAFSTTAINLVGMGNDMNLVPDVYVRDMKKFSTTRVTISTDGGDSNGSNSSNVSSISISANGRFVAFGSDASNLVPDDNNGVADVFVRDIREGITERVSFGHDGSESNEDSGRGLSINPTGRYVLFGSAATNLVANDLNGTDDAFLVDRQTHETTRVSVQPNESEALAQGFAHANGGAPAVSKDGRFVLFRSSKPLVPGDSALLGGCDFFVRDMQRGRTERVNVASDGSAREGGCGNSASLSADGRYVVFTSDQQIAGDDGGCSPAETGRIGTSDFDAYVFDRDTGATELVSRSTKGHPAQKPGTCAGTQQSSISYDGRFVAFLSDATNLVPGDTNGWGDVFVRDRGLALLAHWPGTPGDGGSGDPGTICIPVVGCVDETDSAFTEEQQEGSPASLGPQADLIGIRVAYRPELGDLFLAADIDEMSNRSLSIDPVMYGFRIDAGSRRYEVRAQQVSPILGAMFGLYRCEAGAPCVKITDLGGGLGTTGSRVTVALPLEHLDLGEPARIDKITAFSSLGTYISGPSKILDEVGLR